MAKSTNIKKSIGGNVSKNKTKRKNHQDPIGVCECCNHLIYEKSQAHPEGIKKGSTLPKKCPECKCPDIKPYDEGKNVEKEPDDVPEIDKKDFDTNLDADELEEDGFPEDDLI